VPPAQTFGTLLHPLCTVIGMEEFTPLGAEMARLAGRLGTLVPAVCDREQLEWIVASGRRLEAFAAAQVALATVQLERVLRDEYAETLRDRSCEPTDPDTSAADDASASSGDASTGADGTTTTADGAASGGPEGGAPGGDSSPPGNGAPRTTDETSTAGGDTAASGDGADDTRGRPGEPGGRRESAEELGRQIRRGKWLRRCELFAAALQAGTISAEHVDTLAVVLEHVEPHVQSDVLADEERLVEVARRMARTAFARYLRDVIDRVRADGGMSRFERQLKNSFASFKADNDTQMYRLFCEIDPVRGAEMFQAVQRRVDEMYQTKGATDGLSRNQVVLAALHGLICREPAAAPAVDSDDDDVGGGPEILVICDCQSLVSGPHAHTICETYEGIRLPVSFVRDMCAEAMLTVAIAGADGQILEVGTAERLANRAQRRALRAKYRQCAHPDCTVPFAACRIHHVVPWEQRGPTDIGNLLPLCFKHHHLVHEGGWRLTIDPDRTLHWYRPGGALYATIPFVPLLTPKAQRSATTTTRGSPSGATSGPSPPASADLAPAARSAPAAEDLRLFDPPAA
jgi:hypothetical protein